MPVLEFACTAAEPDRAAAAPSISLRLHLCETTGVRVHALALRTQIRIEPRRRRYGDTEAAALRDLFGDRSRWGDTLQPLQLAFVSQVIPGFAGETDVDLALSCSYDFDVAANKYLYALEDGTVPLLLLFSGTVFTVDGGLISIEPIPWDLQARFALPVSVWKQTMQLHFPGTAWLRLSDDSFDALHRYRIEQQLLSWDDAVQRLLKEAAG